MNFIVDCLNVLEHWLENKWIQIIIIGLLTWLAVHIIGKLLSHFFKKTNFLEEKKEKTIESVTMSVVRYAAVVSYIFFIVSQFVTDVSKILAGAGILGIIIGLGAQNLIKDVLAGIFFLWEKQIRSGDFIRINNTFTGVVLH